MRLARAAWKIFFIGQSWVFTKNGDRYLSSSMKMNWCAALILAICETPVRAQLWFRTVHIPITRHSSSSSMVVFRFSHTKPISAKCTRCADVVLGQSQNHLSGGYATHSVSFLIMVAVRSARGLVPFFNKQNVPRLSHSYLVIIRVLRTLNMIK